MARNLKGVPRCILDRLQQYGNNFPSYVTQQWDPEKWRPFLNEVGCDQQLIRLFFDLNRFTEDGPKCANNILAGFLKKRQDGHNPRSNKVGNPSAWLQTTCRNMMRFLEGKMLDQ